MLFETIFFILGLFVAWFFLPPPQVAKDFRDTLVEKFPALTRYQRKDL